MEYIENVTIDTGFSYFALKTIDCYNYGYCYQPGFDFT